MALLAGTTTEAGKAIDELMHKLENSRANAKECLLDPDLVRNVAKATASGVAVVARAQAVSPPFSGPWAPPNESGK